MRIEKFPWCDLTQNGVLKNINNISNVAGTELTLGIYYGLKNGWKVAHKKFHEEGKKGQSKENFINNTKKGSKQFRCILNMKNTVSAQKGLKKMSQVKTYALWTGSVGTPDARIKGMLGAWNNKSLPGKIRTQHF